MRDAFILGEKSRCARFFRKKKQRCGIFFLREYLLKRMYNDIRNVCICNLGAKIVNLCENTTSHCKRRLSTVSIDKKSTAAKCSGILVIQFSYIITYGTNQHLSEYDTQIWAVMYTNICRCSVRRSRWPNIAFLKHSSKPWQKTGCHVLQLLKYLSAYYEFTAKILKMTIGL